MGPCPGERFSSWRTRRTTGGHGDPRGDRATDRGAGRGAHSFFLLGSPCREACAFADGAQAFARAMNFVHAKIRMSGAAVRSSCAITGIVPSKRRQASPQRHRDFFLNRREYLCVSVMKLSRTVVRKEPLACLSRIFTRTQCIRGCSILLPGLLYPVRAKIRQPERLYDPRARLSAPCRRKDR